MLVSPPLSLLQPSDWLSMLSGHCSTDCKTFMSLMMQVSSWLYPHLFWSLVNIVQKRILQEENPSWCLVSISKELQKTIYTFNENFCCMKFLKLLYSTCFNPYLSSESHDENLNKIFKSKLFSSFDKSRKVKDCCNSDSWSVN